MEKKTILRRAVLIGLVLLVAGLATLGGSALHAYHTETRREAERQAYVAQVTRDYQAYLDETVKRIKTVPVEPRVVGEIQTRHYQLRPALWMYVWAIDNGGNFLFGVPPDEFARLNAFYDQNQAVIKKDGYYANRDQFLRTLLHHPERRLSTPKEDGEDQRHPGWDDEVNWWRFHREDDEWHANSVLFLSTPIQDAGGAAVGTLNLKLCGLNNQRFSPWEDHRTKGLMAGGGIVAGLSLLWLWFMLPTWVYVDARERGVPRALLWSFLTLIGSVFALMVYLIARPSGPEELRCPHCGKTLNGSKAGCPYCGADLSAAFCSRCQYPVKPDWSFCPSCRGSLARTPSPPESTAAAG